MAFRDGEFAVRLRHCLAVIFASIYGSGRRLDKGSPPAPRGRQQMVQDTGPAVATLKGARSNITTPWMRRSRTTGMYIIRFRFIHIVLCYIFNYMLGDS